jgi:spore germination cell wall hydrolase CwlJ-like protein
MTRYSDHLGRPSDADLLARFIWNEARKEGLQGKLAVAHVVMNRVKAREYNGSDA